MRRTDSFDWVKKNELQLTWIANYLKQRFPLNVRKDTDGLISIRKSLINDIEYYCGSDGLHIFVAKMKAAWLQYERRHKKKMLFKTITVEINKRVFRQVETIAKKYNVPINYSVEKLLEKACELENERVNQYERRQTLKEQIEQERQSQAAALGLVKVLAKEPETSLLDKLQGEMYRRHQLTLDLIAYAAEKSSTEKASLIQDERKRYEDSCVELNIDPITDS